ncbi:hypothetical protein FB645_003414 [Coemansia sp. IMI 203386]|nr:hypothetical protein FB645_003414 [Coemansia sp. IMI 203386]
MAKRVADKQLNQDNQYDEDTETSGEQTDGRFRMADKETLSRRAIKVPKSRLRNAAAAATADTSSSNTQKDSTKTAFAASATAAFTTAAPAATTSAPAPAFSGFTGFVAPKPAESKDISKDTSKDTAFANNESSPKGSSGLFKGFSFGQPAAGNKPSFGSFGSSAGGFKIGSFGSAGNTTGTAPASTDKQKDSSSAAAAAGFTMTSFKPPSSGTSFAANPSSAFGTSPKKPSFSSGFVPPGGNTIPSLKSASAATAATLSNSASATANNQQSDDEEALYKNIRGLNVSLQKKISSAIDTNAFVDLTPLLKQYTSHWQKISKSHSNKTETDAGKSNSSPQKPKEALKSVGTQSQASDPVATKPLFAFAASSAPLETKASTAETVKVPDATSPARSSMFASLEKPASKPAEIAPLTATAAKTPTPTKPVAFSFGNSNNIGNVSAGSPSAGFSFSFGKPSSNDIKDGEEAKKPFSFGFKKGTGFGANSPSNAGSSGDNAKPAFAFGFGNSSGNNTSAAAAAAVADAGAQSKDTNDDDSADQDQENDDQEDKKEPTTAGEEGETTEHVVRSKLYMWDSDSKQYKDLGIGSFKVNTWILDNGGKRGRVLCRQEGSDKVTLNAAMFKEMQVENTAGKKEVGILIVDEGKPTRYLVRVKNAEFARNLFNAIEKVKSQL